MRFARSFASARSRQRLSAKMPIFAPSVFGLTNNGPELAAQSPSAAISASPSISLDGGTAKPAAEASARLANLSWHRCAAAAGLANRAKPSRGGGGGNDEPRE